MVALSAVHCTIERDIPLERFACAQGGPCSDAGVLRDAEANDDATTFPDADLDAGPMDTGQEDSGPNDAGAPDSGFPAVSCPDSLPLPLDGRATGTLMNQSSNHNGACADEIGAIEQVYYFQTPGRLSELRVDSSGPGADVILYLYRGECTDERQQACQNDFGIDDEVLLARNLSPSVYYVVVEGALANVTGGYQLAVTGRISLNEPCDPANTFLSCEVGLCIDEGSGFHCRAGKDCGDGIDNDFDQAIDEDAPTCVNPPMVTCPQDQSFAMNNMYPILRAEATDPAPIEGGQWRAVVRPTDSFMPAPPLPPLFFPSGNAFEPSGEVAGEYTYRYSIIDEDLNEIACETKVDMRPNVPLWIELYWGTTAPNEEIDADLHLLTPGMNPWFTSGVDCWSIDCMLNGMLHLGDKTTSPGPEIISVESPLRGNNNIYRVGMEALFSAVGPFNAWVRIFCDGTLQHESLRMGLTNDDINPGANDFWKPARLQMNAGTGCSVTPVGTVVTVDEAYISP